MSYTVTVAVAEEKNTGFVESRTIYTQTVEKLDLPALIAVVNAPPSPPPKPNRRHRKARTEAVNG